MNPETNGRAAAYALLRYALECVLGLPCPEICRTPGGKPYFVGRDDLFFSLSHTETHVLVVLSDRPVGADIQTHRAVTPQLRDRLFTPEEQHDFEFFEGWTLREALFKLTGEGWLMNMRLARENGNIVTPWPDVHCRTYDCIPGCTAAVACRESALPESVQLIPLDLFFA